MRFASRSLIPGIQKPGNHRKRQLLALIAALAAGSALAQQPGPFTANDFQFSSPSGQRQIPPHLYGPDLDGGTPSEIALSAGMVRTRLQKLGFHSFSNIYFRNGYWNVVAYHGNKKRQLTVHPETGVLRSDKPYCNNRCNRYQISDEF
ncbi:hypothetical protein M0G74_10465 [Microbulbifer sp. CAU 1566]|uniref:hypothetical protein n=1 Tax=Microbulbifer sp. CAU 1566 TaxID=2933269 RepID=UPI002004FDA6|nr:hypothetical protein [Microbulbifer sp. CAU 1566]MCK7597691.1 hypothetical protein [Microbulbifer sp. CAU 1566]